MATAVTPFLLKTLYSSCSNVLNSDTIRTSATYSEYKKEGPGRSKTRAVKRANICLIQEGPNRLVVSQTFQNPFQTLRWRASLPLVVSLRQKQLEDHSTFLCMALNEQIPARNVGQAQTLLVLVQDDPPADIDVLAVPVEPAVQAPPRHYNRRHRQNSRYIYNFLLMFCYIVYKCQSMNNSPVIGVNLI